MKLKLQYFGHLMWRADSLEKALMLGKIEGKRRRGQQRMRLLNSITDSMHIKLSKLQEVVKDSRALHALGPMGSQSRTWLGDWTTTTMGIFSFHIWKPQIICSKKKTRNVSNKRIHNEYKIDKKRRHKMWWSYILG